MMAEHMVSEEWRPVVGWEGMYEVSSLGRVKSVNRRIVSSSGVVQPVVGRVLAQKQCRDGYLMVCLCRNNKPWFSSVHRLVSAAFIPNPCGLPQVNHKNLDKSDNRVCNLEWVTQEQNTEHAVANGAFGGPSSGVRLTADDVLEIRRASAAGTSSRALAKMYGSCSSNILAIVNRRTWKRVE